MLSITVVLGPKEFTRRILLRAQRGILISTGRDDIAGGSAVLPRLIDGTKIYLSDFETEIARLKGDFLRNVVEIVIGGIQIILEVHFMCRFISLGRMLLQGSMLMNLINPMRYQVDLGKVTVGLQLVGNVHVVGNILTPGVHFMPHLRQHPSFGIFILVYLLMLQQLHSHVIRVGLRIFAGMPE
jgi:hypothetical protein